METRTLHAAREAELQGMLRTDLVFQMDGREEEIAGEMAVVQITVNRVDGLEVGHRVRHLPTQAHLHLQFLPERVGIDEIQGAKRPISASVIAHPATKPPMRGAVSALVTSRRWSISNPAFIGTILYFLDI